MLEKNPERKEQLHCHISAESKKWLEATKDKLNAPIGAIVDKLVRKAMRRRKTQ